MRLNDFTALGRSLDPRTPSNGAVWLCVAAAWLASGSPRGAAALFFAWAFSRELDPDRAWTAFVSLLLVTPWALTRPEMAQGPLFWLLLAMRTVNRTTGLPSTWLDAALLLWAAWQTASLPVAVLTVVAFALDARLPGGRGRAWLFALLGLAGAARAGAVFATQTLWQAAFLLPLLVVVRATRRVESDSDAGGSGMVVGRVRAGQLLLGVMLLAGLACWGEWWVFAPVWAAVWGTSLGRLLEAAWMLKKIAAPPPLSPE